VLEFSQRTEYANVQLFAWFYLDTELERLYNYYIYIRTDNKYI